MEIFKNTTPSQNEVESQLNIDELENKTKEKGAKFPARWDQFTDNSKGEAILSLLRGGLTNLGFETLTPDWLEKRKKISDDAKQIHEFLDDLEPKNNLEIN